MIVAFFLFCDVKKKIVEISDIFYKIKSFISKLRE